MPDHALALILFLLPLAYSPGPGNMFFAAQGAAFGWRATWRANAGYHLATFGVSWGIGLGFLAGQGAAPGVFLALRWLGAGYVLWLAWQMAKGGAVSGANAQRPAGFVAGGMLLLLNPKAYVIIALMFSQFPAADPRSVLWISALFTVNNGLAFVLWAVLADRLAARYRNRHNGVQLNWLFATLLAGVGGWMLLMG